MSLIAGNLGVVQRLLDAEGLVWAVCAGAAAHLYGQRRPLQDVDLLVAAGKLSDVVRLLQSQNRVVQFDGQRILWRGIKFFDDISIRKPSGNYPFVIDDPMRQRMQRLSLLGSVVSVLPPEDVVLHKLLLDRGAEQGKHDRVDAAGIIRRQQLDLDYMRLRGQAMRLNGILDSALQEYGITL
ncbi:MAG: nucleotidyltransferase family protein [Roseiflexaceae bacterium]